MWCSGACRARVWRKTTGYKSETKYYPRSTVSFPTCDHCGEMWAARRARRIDTYCPKPECRKAFNRIRMRDLNLKVKAQTGVSLWQRRRADPVIREKRRNSDRASYERTGGRRGSKAETYRSADARRRARKTSAEVEVFTNAEIFARDRWRCGVCGRKVDARKTYPDPMSPSLDHVVPLAEGGPHSRANVRLAHLGCNVRRGARGGGEQLALVG